MTIKYITNPKLHTLGEALKRRNIPHFLLSPHTNYFQLGLGVQQRRIPYDNINSALATRICQNKQQTKQFLNELLIPTPIGKKVASKEDLKEAFTQLNKPIVIKPLSEMQGMGITTNITSWGKAEKAYEIAIQYKGSHIIAEEHITGGDYRILILNGRFVAGLKRSRPFILGDGEKTISELVKEDNTKREADDTIIANEVKTNELYSDCLSSQSYTPESIPPAQHKVYTRMTSNICSGGISENISQFVHPSIKKVCIDIGAYFNMEILGVDIITSDISQPLNETGGKVTEINENPSLDMHAAPSIGEPIDIHLLFVDYLYPDPKKAWINISHNGTLIHKREELSQHLASIPKNVTRKGYREDSNKKQIGTPTRPLSQYLLDNRTLSVKI